MKTVIAVGKLGPWSKPMRDREFEAYEWNSEVYCASCLPAEVSDDEVEPIDEDSGFSTDPVCTVCGKVFDAYVSDDRS